MADVVVVGGGVIGVCAAYYLAERGVQVTLIEQGDIAAGSSYGNAGLVVPSHSVPLAAPGVWWRGLRWMANPESPFYIRPRLDPALAGWLVRFARSCTAAHVQRAAPLLRELSRASLSLFRELAALPGLDFGFRQDGVLMVCRSERGLVASTHEAHLLEPLGVSAKVLDAAGARGLEPTLRPDIAGGVYFPDDAHLTPHRFVRGLARRAAELGVTLRTQTEVLGFHTAGGRIVSVETTRGDVPCAEVVLAAGAWSPRIAKPLRLTLPVQAAKGYSITYERPDPGPRLPMLLVESRFAVTPMLGERGALLRLGGTLELAGLDLSVDRRRVAAIARDVRDYLVLPGTMALGEVWRGLRPCTPDGLPLVGRPRRWQNLVVATGHAMIGLSLGPVTGKLVSQVIGGERPSVDVTALHPDRFG